MAYERPAHESPRRKAGRPVVPLLGPLSHDEKALDGCFGFYRILQDRSLSRESSST